MLRFRLDVNNSLMPTSRATIGMSSRCYLPELLYQPTEILHYLDMDDPLARFQQYSIESSSERYRIATARSMITEVVSSTPPSAPIATHIQEPASISAVYSYGVQ